MSNRILTEHVCVVSTKQAPPMIGSSQASDTCQVLDPQTGSVLSSSGGAATVKVGAGVGVHSITPIPLDNLGSLNCQNAYIAYGGKGKDDMNAYLIVQGSTSSPKWKCKLPEHLEGGIIVSPCGNYVLGAARSGNCYCWSLLNEGELIKIWSAHYRPVKAMVFSDCGSYLVTGGADGIANIWSLMEIVAHAASDGLSDGIYGKASLNPVKTWSEHQLPISAMYTLPSSRVVSASLDRQIIIMELFSGKTLAKIAMPSAIHSITADANGHRLYLGSADGTIFCIDLDIFAISTSAESATIVTNSNSERMDSKGPSISGSLLENTILGLQNKGTEASYISELRGHEGEVRSLAFIDHDDQQMLVSGADDGSIKVWDTRSRCCIRTIYPWSSNGSTSMDDKSSKSRPCPCSSIIIIPRQSIESNEAGAFSHNSMRATPKQQGGTIDLLKPLQRFPKQFNSEVDFIKKIIRNEDSGSNKPKRNIVEEENISQTKRTCVESDDQLQSGNTQALTNEVKNLKAELANAADTIDRWQKVNTKLAQKLKNSSKI